MNIKCSRADPCCLAVVEGLEEVEQRLERVAAASAGKSGSVDLAIAIARVRSLKAIVAGTVEGKIDWVGLASTITAIVDLVGRLWLQ